MKILILIEKVIVLIYVLLIIMHKIKTYYLTSQNLIRYSIYEFWAKNTDLITSFVKHQS